MANVAQIIEKVESVANEFGAQIVRQSSIYGGRKADADATEITICFDESRDFSRPSTDALFKRARTAGLSLVDALDAGTDSAWKVCHPKVRGHRVFGVYNDYAGSGTHLLAYRSKIVVKVRG